MNYVKLTFKYVKPINLVLEDKLFIANSAVKLTR